MGSFIQTLTLGSADGASTNENVLDMCPDPRAIDSRRVFRRVLCIVEVKKEGEWHSYVVVDALESLGGGVFKTSSGNGQRSIVSLGGHVRKAMGIGKEVGTGVGCSGNCYRIYGTMEGYPPRSG